MILAVLMYAHLASREQHAPPIGQHVKCMQACQPGLEIAPAAEMTVAVCFTCCLCYERCVSSGSLQNCRFVGYLPSLIAGIADLQEAQASCQG